MAEPVGNAAGIPLPQGSTWVPLGDKPYSTAVISVGRELCENFYMEIPSAQGAKAPYFFVKIPGLRLLSPQGSTSPCRGIITASNFRTFVVAGTTLAELFEDGSSIPRTTALRSSSGTVSMADNGTHLLLVDGVDGWVLTYETGAVVRLDPATEAQLGFPAGATHCRCIDTYFLANNPRTNEYHWSDPGDGLSWSGLNVGMKIGKPDNVIALEDCANMLWVVGMNSIEVHYDTGDFAGQLWARYQGAIIEVGCCAPYSVARYANNVFWMGVDSRGTVGVFTNEGFVPKRVSERGIEQIIQGGRYDDCQAFTFAQNGHAFYVMQFPEANRTLVYDLTVNRWYNWTYLRAEDGTIHRWRGSFAAYNWSRNLLGDTSTDAVYWSDQKAYANDNPDGSGVNYIQCVKTTPVGFQLGAWVRYNWFQPMFQPGVGLAQDTAEGVGVDPVAMIAWSNDSGATWSNERRVSIGAQGQYQKRSRLTMCGTSRNRQWRIIVTDPVPVILVGALAGVQPLGR